jgi:hypothetical protein
MDYELLLKKYINLVGWFEGVNFVDEANEGHGFTPEEVEALKQAAAGCDDIPHRQ